MILDALSPEFRGLLIGKDGASVVEIRGVKVDTVVAEVGAAYNTDHTAAEHNQVGCRIPTVEHCKLQPYA
ncbi:hypothetical protein Tco_1213593 [Tanacetum coccineum]